MNRLRVLAVTWSGHALQVAGVDFVGHVAISCTTLTYSVLSPCQGVRCRAVRLPSLAS